QRVLREVEDVDLSCTLFSQRLSLPIALGPVGLTGMYARRGEVQAVRAAAARNIPFCLSTVSVCALDEVVAASSRPIWFQIYVIRDRGFMR
ncbi:alpha-hydroxy-acid oxidizing protein, partial [Escherichia coli]|nr:alpha-hydroxy-acid oxidizing protein [Escherichia coli]